MAIVSRVVLVPDFTRLNPYIANWSEAAGLQPCMHISRENYANTIFNRQWLRANRDGIDAIHLHWKFDRDNPLATILAFRECHRLGIKLIWTAHEVRAHDNTGSPWSFIIKLALARYADRVVAHTEHAAETVKRTLCYRSQPIVVEFPDYSISRLTKAIAKSQLGENRFLYLCFGAIKPYDESKLDAVLWIAGEMPRHNAATLRVSKSGVVIQTAPLSETQLSILVGAADVCILPYLWGTTSGALSYARHYGKLTIVSNARCFDSKHPNQISFATRKDLKHALNLARMISQENDISSPRNVDLLEYRTRVRNVYDFEWLKG